MNEEILNKKLNIGIAIGEVKKISMTALEKKLVLESVYNVPLRAKMVLSPYSIYSFVSKFPRNAFNFAVKHSSPIIRFGVVKPIRGAITFLTSDWTHKDKKTSEEQGEKNKKKENKETPTLFL
jgi:hypothetical protein